MAQVTLDKNQMRAETWCGLIRACYQSGQTVVNWCQESAYFWDTLFDYNKNI